MSTVISYLLSFVSTVLGLCEPFSKKMRTVLAFNFTGNLLVGISYLLVDSLSGAAICAVACVQVFINYFFDKKKIKIPYWLVAVYIVSFLAVNFVSFARWYDVFSLIASVLFVVSVSQSESKHYRIYYFLNSTIWIFYDFLSASYGNLTTHVVLFVATFIAIYSRDVKTNKQKQ